MRNKRVIILIDGQNLYHSLRNVGLRELDINWTALLHSLLEEDDELVRTYWFRPEKLQDIYLQRRLIAKSILKEKYADQYDRYKGLEFEQLPEALREEAEAVFKDRKEWLSLEKQKFSQVDFKYSQIENEYEDLEIYRSGILKIDPYNKLILTEKGVDIALAVKMIEFTLTGKCDKIILFSGDLDYAEAVKVVKDNMKKVHIVTLHKTDKTKTFTMSRKLAFMADKVIDVYEADLRSRFKK